ncbi:hypothetical protein TNCV_2961981 [Trichonephila clavipes]|nr:hypothetical protein TNCV_2961981 [Trichonephila clavipes]
MTTPELAPTSPNYHTTPTGGGLSPRQIYLASPPYMTGLPCHRLELETAGHKSVTLTTRLLGPQVFSGTRARIAATPANRS